MTIKSINIASDFTKYPSGRVRDDSPHSGAAFRDDFLIPGLQQYDTLEVTFDGLRSCGASFLEEAFGGLVRSKLFSKNELRVRLKLKAEQPAFTYYRDMALALIKNAHS